MSKKIAIIISPNYKDYAKKYLADCITSIRKQDYQGEMKIFLTDNLSTPESYNYLVKIAPEAELILNKTNDGYAKGCNDSIKQAILQSFDYIAIFNIHTNLEVDCLREMIKVIESDKKIGAVQSRMMLYPRSTGSGQAEKELINSLGNITHFLGFGYCSGYREKWIEQTDEIKNIFYPSGSSFLVKREILEKVGLFDEEFWMYNEDQDLGWRIWLAGFRCVLASKAVLFNKYEFERSIKKYYWMDRNRIIAMEKNYHWLTLLLIAPACLVMEIGLIIFAIKGGWFKEKLRVYCYFLNPVKWIYLWQARQQTQKLRQVKDKEIAKMISGRIWYQEIDDVKLRLVNPVFNLYWRIVKILIRW